MILREEEALCTAMHDGRVAHLLGDGRLADALTDLLGSEEGFKDLGHDLASMPLSVPMTASATYLPAANGSAMWAPYAVVQAGVAALNSENAALRHGVPSVNDEICGGVLKFTDVDIGQAQAGADDDFRK